MGDSSPIETAKTLPAVYNSNIGDLSFFYFANSDFVSEKNMAKTKILRVEKGLSSSYFDCPNSDLRIVGILVTPRTDNHVLAVSGHVNG